MAIPLIKYGTGFVIYVARALPGIAPHKQINVITLFIYSMMFFWESTSDSQ